VPALYVLEAYFIHKMPDEGRPGGPTPAGRKLAKSPFQALPGLKP